MSIPNSRGQDLETQFTKNPIYAPDNSRRMCIRHFRPPREILFERQLVQPKCHSQLTFFQLDFDDDLFQRCVVVVVVVVVDVKCGRTVDGFDEF